MISAVAGTFDVLHDGHRRLLERAFEIGDIVYVGITSDKMASGSRKDFIPLYLRKTALCDYLDTLGQYIIFEIDDVYGPSEMMDDVDVLVVSEETEANGNLVNERRLERGLPAMKVDVVPLVLSCDGDKISSSRILSGDYSRSGRRDCIDVAVGSANHVKVEAVRSVFERIYGDVCITAYDVDSGVPPQPFGDQTHQGSLNRALAALHDHDIAVGIEAGVFEMLDGLYDIQHCSVVSSDGRMTFGHGSGFRYPDDVAELVRGGMTVGDAIHTIYGDTDIGSRQGAIGLLSRGLLDRKALTEQSVLAAMIPRLYGD